MKTFGSALMLFITLTVLTGGIYPALVTLLGQLMFSKEAGGSLIVKDGKVVGSELIGQPFASNGYFWSRPSATGPFAYNAGASSGSNLAPSNPQLRDTLSQRIKTLRDASPRPITTVPVDLVTSSGSGLDPHISIASAIVQLPRVAQIRGLSEEQLRALVVAHQQQRLLGVLGEARVNVVLLNRALDQMVSK